jgi:histidinol-phosphatase (PHP family)
MAAEVSSAGWRKPAAEAYPNVELLKQLFLLKVPVTTASDAHVLADIGKDFSKLRVLLDNIGYKSVTRFSKREGFSHPLER